jgi:ribonuclease-3
MTLLPTFRDQKLFTTALTHRSSLNEGVSDATESNERLEFLGDAVLELVTTEFLYKALPDLPEGRLTALRSSLVKTTTLAAIARELDLGQQLHMSKGEEGTGGRDNENLLADAMEALLGALYLDQGIPAVAQFLQTHLFPKLTDIMDNQLDRDPKSSLQEEVQALGLPTPVYEVIEETGPDHDKHFVVAAIIDQLKAGVGSGKSKQAAQQDAAAHALQQQLYKRR